MKISKVCEPLLWLYYSKMYIKITILLLCLTNHPHELSHSPIDFCIILPLQKIAGALNPFRNIGIPKQMIWYWPHVWFVVIRWMPLELESIVSTRRLQDVQLVQQSIRIQNLTTSADETRACERGIRERVLRIRHG